LSIGACGQMIWSPSKTATFHVVPSLIRLSGPTKSASSYPAAPARRTAYVKPIVAVCLCSGQSRRYPSVRTRSGGRGASDAGSVTETSTSACMSAA